MNTFSHNQHTEINLPPPLSAENEILRNRKKADITRPLLNEDQDPNENLKQIDEGFYDSHFLSHCWLYAVLVGAFCGVRFSFPEMFIIEEKQVFEVLARYGYFTLLFLQSFLETRAMLKKDLAKANFALKIILFNTVVSVLHTLFLGYKTFQYSASYSRSAIWIANNSEEMIIFLIFSLVFTTTNILFTLLPAIKVRNDLLSRQTIRNTLHKI